MLPFRRKEGRGGGGCSTSKDLFKMDDLDYVGHGKVLSNMIRPTLGSHSRRYNIDISFSSLLGGMERMSACFPGGGLFIGILNDTLR